MKKVQPQDLKDALTYLNHVCGLDFIHGDDSPEEWKKAYKIIKHKFEQALTKSNYKTLSLKTLKKTPLFDNGRRPNKKHSKNPIIVAQIKRKLIILDGNHRVIQAIENKTASIKAFIIPLDKQFESLIDIEGEY